MTPSDSPQTLLATARQLAESAAANGPARSPTLAENARSVIASIAREAGPSLGTDVVSPLLHQAGAVLDPQPVLAWALALVAHELARTTADVLLQAEGSRALGTALNRIGEFRTAVALAEQAAASFFGAGHAAEAARAWGQAAWAASYLGELSRAEADLARARDLDPADEMRARGDRIEASIRRARGEYAPAHDLLSEAHDRYLALAQPLEAARCRRDLAQLSIVRGHLTVEDLIQHTRELFETAHGALDAALCGLFLGQLRTEQNRHAEAVRLLLDARRELARLGAGFFAAWCDLNLGVSYYHLTRFDEALCACQQARDYFHTHDVPVEVSACDINLGNIHYVLNRYDEALTYYEEAARLCAADERPMRMARIYGNMALVYAKQGRLAQALALHQRALDIFHSHGNQVMVARARVNLAAAWRVLGSYTRAAGELQQAHQVFADGNLAEHLAECSMDLASTCLALGQPERAALYLEEAGRLCAEHGWDSFLALCDRLLAQAVGGQGEKGQALGLVERARASFLKRDQLVDGALCDLVEGELYIGWNEPERARPCFQSARRTLMPGFPDYAWRADFGLGECARAEARPAEALDAYLSAVRSVSRSRTALVSEELSNALYAARQPLHDAALSFALEQSETTAALEIMEAGKARALLGLLGRRQWKARPGGAVAVRPSDPARGEHTAFGASLSDLVRRERELRYELEALRGRVMVRDEREAAEPLRGAQALASVSGAALEELNSLSRAYEAVVMQLRLTTTGLAGVPEPAPFHLQAFRQAVGAYMGDDWAALDYVLRGDELITAIVKPTRLRIQRQALSDYDRAILAKCTTAEPDLREQIYRGTIRGVEVPSPGEAYLRHLFRLLIPEGLTAHQLILAPHRLLHTLPFQSLRNGDAYLVERHTLVYTPNLQVLQVLLDQPQPGGGTPLVVGISQFGDALAPLPHALSEVERLRQVFGGEGEYWKEGEATRQRLLELNASGELKRIQVFHLATHAALDPLAPHLSRVVLADGDLTVTDILDLDLDARLVTLSACQTALGHGGQGDELVGLVRAFFYAGARAILAMLWPVEDASMAEMSAKFYRHWLGGAGAAGALRAAQLEMIHDGCAPYQWAAPLLIGQP